ncbi:MAG: hypothetical protein Q9194_000561 [Teloschistes cf. exilis]
MADESSVREVVEHIGSVCQYDNNGEAPQLVYRRLADLISQCLRLKSIKFDLRASHYHKFFLPCRLFEIIESIRPTVSLLISNILEAWPNFRQLWEPFLAFADAGCLYSLQIYPQSTLPVNLD